MQEDYEGAFEKLNKSMGILNSLKRRLNYVVVKPLLYNQELADAYSGTSVVDGELKGKTVVVTGATGGIGRAIVKRFLMEGYHHW